MNIAALVIADGVHANCIIFIEDNWITAAAAAASGAGRHRTCTKCFVFARTSAGMIRCGTNSKNGRRRRRVSHIQRVFRGRPSL